MSSSPTLNPQDHHIFAHQTHSETEIQGSIYTHIPGVFSIYPKFLASISVSSIMLRHQSSYHIRIYRCLLSQSIENKQNLGSSSRHFILYSYAYLKFQVWMDNSICQPHPPSSNAFQPFDQVSCSLGRIHTRSRSMLALEILIAL